MKLSKISWQTHKEVPSDAEIPSHQLLIRAGLIYKTAAGLYTYLPFALRSMRKIENIIREELERINCQEILMPVITPSELWKESGRWDTMGPQMLKIKDRAERELCVSPTNEESVTDFFRKTFNSYKQLPVCFFQINTKFRDEIRPRFGLLRAREFSMKDAYSFHLNMDCLDKFYQEMYQAYKNIFDRLGLEYIVVEADGGAMAKGGARTHEFQLVADNGEDTLIYEPKNMYAANIEKAQTSREVAFSQKKELNKIATPNLKTCADVCKSLGLPLYHSLKSLLMVGVKDDKEHCYMVLLLGDDELNEIKLKNQLELEHLKLATQLHLDQYKLVKGFMGPYNIKDINLIYDQAIDLEAGYIIGANEIDYHLTGFSPSRDTKNYQVIDIRMSQAGDLHNGEKVLIKKGIEVGHIFQLGDQYTKSLKASVLNEKGQPCIPFMGCYGIGVTRTFAASIEQSHDSDGIIWPKSIAPFHVYFAVIGKSEAIKNIAQEIYQSLCEEFEVLFDDRGLGPGQMFKDADLLGIPLRVVLGERDFLEKNEIEIKIRKTKETFKSNRENLSTIIKEKLSVLK